MSEFVRVVEVGPRDGLQNEKDPIPTEAKIKYIELLKASGLGDIEATSFVHPKWVPQLADCAEVLAALNPSDYWVLIPNEKGLERALEAGCRQIAVFTAASETFSQKNTNRSIAESLESLRAVVKRATAEGLRVRGYLSTAFVCPYEGNVPTAKVVEVCTSLVEMGIREVSVSDTIGAAVPRDVKRVLDALLEHFEIQRLALHFHDTYGTALANVVAGLDMGIRTFDSSSGGLGGCPYAPGAAGNLATEDLLYLLTASGYDHGVDFDKVLEASRFMAKTLGRELPSRQLRRVATGQQKV